MKTKILLAAVLVLNFSFLQAQIDIGRVQIGGSIGLGYQKNGIDAYNNTSISLSPSIGTFYKTNHLVGAFLKYGYDEYPVSINSNTVKDITRTYGVGIFFRRYKPVVKNLYLFFDERGSFNYQNQTNGLPPSKLYISDVSVQPGLAYNFTRSLQLETTFNNLLNIYYSGGQGTNSFFLSSSLESNLLSNVALGFRFYLK